MNPNYSEDYCLPQRLDYVRVLLVAERKRRASEIFRYPNYWKPIRVEHCRRAKYNERMDQSWGIEQIIANEHPVKNHRSLGYKKPPFTSGTFFMPSKNIPQARAFTGAMPRWTLKICVIALTSSIDPINNRRCAGSLFLPPKVSTCLFCSGTPTSRSL